MTANEGFRGRRALVTGGATGLGLAVSRALLAGGAEVAATYRPGGHTEGIEALVAKYGDRVHPCQCDLADSGSVDRAFDEAAGAMSGVDLLVNNAGIWLSNPFEDIAVRDWDRTFAVNVRAPFILCQRFIRQGVPGKIVNVTSQAAFHGSTSGHADYAASKAALVTMTISLAREVARKGVNANCVAVGMMRSNMVREALEKNEESYLARIPKGRVAESEDITGTVLFLLGPDSDYITGATIDATGGMLMR
ncbi:SDR family NAD(P)-dependent oxidoreductase [Actinomyces radicidentis]|uniref:Ketoreductase domain-containing protein n=1 Tax=Actinomyces radicidentis TaxID=111015 RepID=A0A0X8JF80_ACTRD|nr:SDR family oxidoreductase [Actinomyces radicidentis]AMD87744.1 hypothetical protein AXF14_09290 [Actinomyces radicidentis]